ncbi:hypothetical protein HK105_206516 [Polyrhizophydium stewartii]|uniref:Ankyrin repeat domain-containing protein n=1 Tax=Polyrhizophydium stewartii TaxID=2732419 RepID=A0ABR4N363_9FUNG
MPAEIQHMILAAAGPFTRFVNGLQLRAELRALPKQQHVQVWQDAVDSEWQGELAQLPPLGALVAALRVPTRAALARVVARTDKLFRAGCVASAAIRNGWKDVLDGGDVGALAVAAAEEGAVGVLADMMDARRVPAPVGCELVEHAACSGRLEVVRLLHERAGTAAAGAATRWSTNVGDFAAQSGNLDLVMWVRDHRPECLAPSAIEAAAGFNHMHVVRWLVETAHVRCDGRSGALRGAAFCNNLEMVEYLCERFPHLLPGGGGDVIDGDGDTLAGMASAGAADQILSSGVDVIEWLDRRGMIMDPRRLVEHAILMGSVDALQWLTARFSIRLHAGDLDEAHLGGQPEHTRLLKWAYETHVPVTSESMALCVFCNNIDVLAWAVARDPGMMAALVEAVTTSGSEMLVEWLVVRHGVVFGQTQLDLAIRAGNGGVAACLLKMDQVEWDLAEARRRVERLDNEVHERAIPVIRKAIRAADARRRRRAQASQDAL